MKLNLYRRHRRDCKVAHPHNSVSSEFEERKKTWKRCSCPIFVSGTLNRKFHRMSTGEWEWKKAQAVAGRFETAGTWDNLDPAPSAPTAPQPDTERTTLGKAVRAYKAELTVSHAMTTIRGYGYLLDDFEEYGRSKGYVYIDQWEPFDVRAFRASWGVKLSTAAKKMATLKAFFGYVKSNRWMLISPVDGIKEKSTRKEKDAENAPRILFSDEDIARMLTACDADYGMRDVSPWERQSRRVISIEATRVADARYRWNGRDLADFILISIYTGLRISDVATFNADRLAENGECRIRTVKNHAAVCTYLPPWLQERIRQRVQTHGRFIFGTHDTEDICVITDVWRRKLSRLWELCGPWAVRPVHHRYRHTFARILLQSGVEVQDVAELLGDTEAMVRKHYSQWVPERQQRLTKLIQKAFVGAPQPSQHEDYT